MLTSSVMVLLILLTPSVLLILQTNYFTDFMNNGYTAGSSAACIADTTQCGPAFFSNGILSGEGASVSVIPVHVYLDSSVMVWFLEMTLNVLQVQTIVLILSSTMEQESPVLIQFQIALQDFLTVEMETNVFLQQMIVKLLPA